MPEACRSRVPKGIRNPTNAGSVTYGQNPSKYPAAPRPGPEMPSRTSHLLTPKLLTVLREGYTRGNLASDALSALTVAIVALPLSMAIAIASGVEPQRGLYAAIIGGFLVSALGGSRHQIG